MPPTSGSLIRVDDREVQAALKSLGKVVVNSATRLVPVARRQMLAVETKAKTLAPHTNMRALIRSGRSDAQAVGNTIRGTVTFGGLASAYAEVQHENESFAHTPAEYQAKYGKPLNRTGYSRQTLRGRRNKRGKIVLASKTWKYKRKRKITGYQGGQAHFLHGAPNSAWNAAAAARLREAVVTECEQQVQDALSNARAD